TIPAEIHAEIPTIPFVVPTLPYTSPFLYTDSFDSDTYKRPPSQDSYIARWRSTVAARSSPLSSPTHDSSPVDVTLPTRQILPAPPGLPRRPAILILPGQPILIGRPYHTQPNEVRKMLTARKSVRPLPSHRLTLRYSESHSPSDHFSPDNFASDTSSSSSSGYSPDTSSGPYIPDSSFGVLSPVRANLLPPCKRTKGSIPASDRAGSAESSYETYTEPDIDSDVQVDINDDTKAAAAREADIIVKVSIGFKREDEADSRHRGTVEIGVDTVVEPVVSEDTPAPTDDEGSREVVQIGLDEIVQELYDHVLDIP
ncbi:hypothetical protein Tco_0081854, partial [Tanacetum coccineum]